MDSFWGFLFARKKTIETRMSGEDKLSIMEWNDQRALFFNNIPYSKITKGSYFTGSYYDFFIPLPSIFRKNSVKMLILGLGGGTMPYQMRGFYGNKVKITAVEPNKDMIEMAKKFVPRGLKNTRVIMDDGFGYLKAQREKYDILVLDAYVRDHMPEPFYTEEFINLANKALAADGILAINFAFDAIRLPMYIRRLKKHFKQVYRLSHIMFGNYIIICSKKLGKDEILKRANLGVVKDGQLKSIPQLYNNM